jgi:predicted kinase
VPVAVFLLSGLPGSGKTTFALALVAVSGAVHVESDAIRRETTERPEYTPREHERVFGEVERRVARALGARLPVVVDATNLKAQHRVRYYEMAADAHVPVVAIRLTAPFPVLRARVSGGRDGHSQADTTVLRNMRGSEERFATPVLMVDTRYSTAPSIDLAVELAGLPR